MLKKVGYHNGLIPIGNANVYQGKPVWTDGRVAYGWHYNIQNAIQAENRKTAGLWVAAENNRGHVETYWCLMDENLNFKNVPIRGLPTPNDNVYNYYCYPWVCCTWEDWSDSECPWHGEMIYSNTNHYEFKGQIVQMDNDGKVLTYYDVYDRTLREYTQYWLCQYENDGSVTKTDLKPLHDKYGGFCDWYRISHDGENHPGFIFTALNTNGAYVTVHDENDQDHPYKHFYASNGTCTEQPFPTHIDLSSKAKLILPSLDLIVNGTTYGNDILQLLKASTWPGLGAPANCVHAYNDIVIAQYSNAPDGQYGVMFKDGTLYSYNSFYDIGEGEGVNISPQRCWSLAEIPGGQWYINYNPYE